MPAIELIDETYVVADPSVVAAVVHDPARWTGWWPDLTLTPFMDRGGQGIRWSAVSSRWVGSLEIWLEAVGDGVLVHHYQRLDPARGSGPVSRRAATRERTRRARDWKQHAFALKDDLEGARRPGTKIHPDGSRSSAPLPRKGG
jgi:hypothetical protein